MTKLSVNINKIATIRNARGGSIPNVVQAAIDCQRYGAQGITVHPRPDERHITRQDVFDLKPVVSTEFNIEGYPSKEFLEMIFAVKPEQATLVPDGKDVLTSNAGWDTIKNFDILKGIISEIKSHGIRTSIFIDPDEKMIEHAAKLGSDRIELYTESYASNYLQDRENAIANYIIAAKCAIANGLGINAGHDLNLENLAYFAKNIPGLLEVSIGHALISDALYYGLENTIAMYLRQLK
ncbi:MAG: pyridoxine 5'-phosphate synthase [Bacteroidota bacterium]